MADGTGSLSSFLFQGTTPVPAPTGSDTSTAFPLWLQDAIYGTVAGAANLAQTPYTPFPGPLVAAPSGATTAAQGLAASNVGNWMPGVNQAGALNTYAANAAQAAQQQAFGNSGIWSPYLGQAGALTANAAGGTANAANQIAQSFGNYQPYLNQAGALTANAAGGTTAAANQIAQNYGNYLPYLNTAAGLTSSAAQPINAGAISQYLNPEQSYITGALNTNLMQNILPGVQDRFVSSGQAGSPQEAQLTDQAIYGTQQAAGQALAGAYNAATQTAEQQQAATLAAGQQYGALGQYAAGLAGNQAAQALQAAGQQAGIGNQYGALAQYTAGLPISQAQGALSAAAQQAGIGQQYGALGQYAQQYGINDINTLLSTANAQTGIGGQAAQLGALKSQLGAVDVGQLSASGQQQDTLAQANINAALNQFTQQQQWPYQNLAYLSDVLRGTPVQAAGTTTQTAGTAYPSSYGASPFATFLGTAGLTSALGLARGGHIRTGALSRAYERRAPHQRNAAPRLSTIVRQRKAA